MTILGTIVSNLNVQASKAVACTPGTTVTVDLSLNGTLYSWTAAQNCTVNCSSTIATGSLVVIKVANDTTPRVVTFGTGFVSSGIATGTISKSSQVIFVSDGTNLYETARTVGI